MDFIKLRVRKNKANGQYSVHIPKRKLKDKKKNYKFMKFNPDFLSE